MDLYHAGLFFHIMGGIVLVSMGFIMPILSAALHRTPTVAGVREWGGAMLKYSKLGSPAAVIVLLTGLYMTWSEFSFSQAWIIVSLVLFVIAGGIAGGVLEPWLKKVVAAAEEAPDGPVPSDLRAVAANPRAEMFETLMFGIDLAIVFMMTNKPGMAGSLVAVGVGMAISGALILRRSRSRSVAPAHT